MNFIITYTQYAKDGSIVEEYATFRCEEHDFEFFYNYFNDNDLTEINFIEQSQLISKAEWEINKQIIPIA